MLPDLSRSRALVWQYLPRLPVHGQTQDEDEGEVFGEHELGDVRELLFVPLGTPGRIDDVTGIVHLGRPCYIILGRLCTVDCDHK